MIKVEGSSPKVKSSSFKAFTPNTITSFKIFYKGPSSWLHHSSSNIKSIYPLQKLDYKELHKKESLKSENSLHLSSIYTELHKPYNTHKILAIHTKDPPSKIVPKSNTIQMLEKNHSSS